MAAEAKSYSQRGITDPSRIYNYRLSRARRVVENAFGILAKRFRCLLTTMQQQPDNVATIVQACCVLHNLLRTRYPRMTNMLVDRETSAHQLVPGAWRDEAALVGLDHMGGNNASRQVRGQRDYLRQYYQGPGKVPWQDYMI